VISVAATAPSTGLCNFLIDSVAVADL